MKKFGGDKTKIRELQRLNKVTDPCDICEIKQATQSCLDRGVEVMRMCLDCWKKYAYKE